MIFLQWEIKFSPIVAILAQESDFRLSVSCFALCQAQQEVTAVAGERGDAKPENNGRGNSEELDVKGDFQGGGYQLS